MFFRRFCLFIWILLLVDHSGQAGSKSAEEGDTTYSPREVGWCQAHPKENTLLGQRGDCDLCPWNCQYFLWFSVCVFTCHWLLCMSWFYLSSAPEHSAWCVPLDDEWREEDSICPYPGAFHPFLFGGRRERQKLWQNHVHLHEGILGLSRSEHSKVINRPKTYFYSIIRTSQPTEFFLKSFSTLISRPQEDQWVRSLQNWKYTCGSVSPNIQKTVSPVCLLNSGQYMRQQLLGPQYPQICPPLN